MTAESVGRWLWPAPDASDRPIVVVHFPHAGGSSVSYRSWIRFYPPDIGFLSIEMPGRGQRSDEPAAESIETSAEQIAKDLRAWSHHRVVLFGHSMGALLAFEVARRAAHQGWQASGLVVSGSRAPSEDLGRPRIAHLNSPHFDRRAVELGLAPGEITGDPELAALFIEPLRADLALCEGYPWGRSERVTVPLAVLSGKEDHLVPLSSARSWQHLSERPGSVATLAGGHMFVMNAARQVVDMVSAIAHLQPRC